MNLKIKNFVNNKKDRKDGLRLTESFSACRNS